MTQIFDFNFYNKAFDLLGFSKEEKTNLLKQHNALLVAKMIDLGGLSNEEIQSFEKENDPTKLFMVLSEKAKNDSEFLLKLSNFIHDFNLEFVENFAKVANPKQKTALVNYFNEYEQQLQNLPQ